MNTLLKSLLVTVAVTSLLLAGCEVQKTQEGVAPKVNVTEGQLPKYDVTAPEVTVGTKEKTITVPDVDIKPAPETDKK